MDSSDAGILAWRNHWQPETCLGLFMGKKRWRVFPRCFRSTNLFIVSVEPFAQLRLKDNMQPHSMTMADFSCHETLDPRIFVAFPDWGEGQSVKA
jgi:hypothetical protein